ncbi:MAG: MarR family EPS-associated transcriptional regulator [Desulfobacterales bacterium]|nr:MarR family EPS-associated transcriptional regulator [Desulfobacterales bacterium]
MNTDFQKEVHYKLLKLLGRDETLTQRQIARKMGISLGLTNYCIAELGRKGFIKIKRFQSENNKMRYIYNLTPKGFEEKAALTFNFLKRKMFEYEEIKRQIQELTLEIQQEETGNPSSKEILAALNEGPNR